MFRPCRFRTIRLTFIFNVENKIFVSAISVWEIAVLVQKKRLRMTLPVQDWIREAKRLPFLSILPIDDIIALQSVLLPDFKNPDPADRLIVATARHHNCPLVTKDQKIIQYPHVTTIW